MNEEAACKPPMDLAEEMVLTLTNHCVIHGIPLLVRLGEEAEAECLPEPSCPPASSWRRAELDGVLADINERICVIAGCEEETMDRRLHRLFTDLADTLMPR
jgi:hypothetical protein